MGPVLKNATNPHLKVKYADLGSVLDTITEPLQAHGLLVVQRFDATEWGAVLITDLIHVATGEKLTSAVPVASKDPTDPQKMGGAITYYRRYSLLALLGLAPEDDDGNAASQPAQPPARAPETRPQPSSAPERPAVAPQSPQPPKRKMTDAPDEELLAWVRDEGFDATRRYRAAEIYLSRAKTEFEVLRREKECTAVHPEDAAELREKALGALRDRQPGQAVEGGLRR
jgi:hypothetical protein